MQSNRQMQATRDALPGGRPVQIFWTWLTGLPATGELPAIRWTPWTRLAVSLLVLGSGVAAATWATSGPAVQWLALVPAWLLTTGALRHLYIVTGHYAAHSDFSGSKRVDRALAELFSTLSFTIPFDLYRRDHARFHHSSRLGTPLDPDVRFLWRSGFGPGRSMAQLWLRLATSLISPVYHGRYLWGRIRSNLWDAPRYRVVLGWAYVVSTALVLAATGSAATWALVWLVPAVLGFQASALLQFLSEHRWWLDLPAGKLRLARLTFGRFLLLPFPDRNLTGPARHTGALASFWAKVLLLQLPARIAVLVGDLPQHDLHHRRSVYDWANAVFVRQRDVEAGSPGFPEPYGGVAGTLADHVGEVFRSWAERGRPTAEELAALESAQ
ncbi:fatty acid desaturase [Engelhardtia mirabilis]|uniref:Fatty acid desaturase n=1 Tax=Engelhardtia mirabilis TaxID=2528011 RepID=A0A518BKZ0_9BACT|nr:Fatty acid desaturase [Planctomycetes bacterium Pla133]QDV01970.1 Fatty acid desaturase [Planctomycetes bacterium Pla86]